MTYLEIYNDNVTDLLFGDLSSTALNIRESKTEGRFVQGLKHFVVSSPEDVRKLMLKASVKRATGATQMNAVSSRSHAICALNVTIAPLDAVTNNAVHSKLSFVDLAGSKNIKKMGAEGECVKEANNINRELIICVA
jgi:hypothetical protein